MNALSTNEWIFTLLFLKMHRNGELVYVDPHSKSINEVNRDYLRLFPKMKENTMYVLPQVYLGTILQVLKQPVPDINQHYELLKFIDNNKISRDITLVPSVNIPMLSLDFVCVEKRNGKFVFSNTISIDGNQHNIFADSTETKQIMRDVVKDVVLDTLNIPSNHFDINVSKCGRDMSIFFGFVEDYIRKLIF